MNISKTKIVLVSIVCASVFLLGRATAPKPEPEVRVIDNTKSIEKALEETTKQMMQSLQKQVVLEKHTVQNKTGALKTNVKKTITYNKNLIENVNQKTRDEIKTSIKQTAEVKHAPSGIDYTFMMGRSFSDTHYDYLVSVGVPLFAGIKANGGYEFQDKRIFVGATLNY